MSGSIQTANILSELARSMLRNLTIDRTRQLLMDAMEATEVFKLLLRTQKTFSVAEPARKRLAHHLISAALFSVHED